VRGAKGCQPARQNSADALFSRVGGEEKGGKNLSGICRKVWFSVLFGERGKISKDTSTKVGAKVKRSESIPSGEIGDQAIKIGRGNPAHTACLLYDAWGVLRCWEALHWSFSNTGDVSHRIVMLHHERSPLAVRFSCRSDTGNAQKKRRTWSKGICSRSPRVLGGKRRLSVTYGRAQQQSVQIRRGTREK